MMIAQLLKVLVGGVALILVSCNEKETNEPLSESRSRKLLEEAVGYAPSEARLIYSWRHCCKSDMPLGGWPGSFCAVYQLGSADFQRVQGTLYEKYSWGGNDTKCWAYDSREMKGCSEFPAHKHFPNGAKFSRHGFTCHGPEGVIMNIDTELQVVMIERYFHD